jgi:hypothetical protein
MKILSTKIHGAIDYLMGAGMIITPFALHDGFTNASTCILVCAGAGTLINSLTTNYEFGLTANISMPNHLKIDVIVALLVCLLPLLFSTRIYLPGLLFGSAQLTLAVITSKNAFHKMFHPFTCRKFEKFPTYH